VYEGRVIATKLHGTVAHRTVAVAFIVSLGLLVGPLGCAQLKKLSGDDKSESDEDRSDDAKEKDDDDGVGEQGKGKPAGTATAKPTVAAFAEIDIGDSHGCVRKSDGGVLCWGSTASSRMGKKVKKTDPPRQLKPTAVAGLPKATQLAVEAQYSCIVGDDTKVYCWGDPPNGFSHEVKAIDGLSAVSQVSVGREHVCAVLSSGALQCWGDGDDGKLGDGATEDRKSPVAVTGVSDALTVSAATNHTCVLHKSGSVSCWGDNRHGQLGDGSKEASSSPKPVVGLGDAVALASKGSLNCAVRSNGKVTCWGRNLSGGLGQKKILDTSKPNEVPGVDGATGVAVSDAHACASAKDGSVWCWGGGSDGQTAQGYTPSAFKSFAPGKVAGLSGATMVAAAERASCAITENGQSAHCWGRATHGRLGNGWTVRHPTPVNVAGLDGAKVIAVGRDYSCAMMGNGAVRCWGDGSGSMLMSGEANARQRASAPPVEVRGASDSRRLFSSGGIVGTQDELGKVQLWFGGVFRLPDQLEDNSRWVPAVVEGLEKVASMASDSDEHYAALASGKLVQLSLDEERDGETIKRKATTRSVIGFNDVSQVTASNSGRVCALRKNGKVSCFVHERKSGKQPTTPLSPKRVAMTELKDVAEVAMRSSRGCARHKDGSVSCWDGFNARDPKPKVALVDGLSGAERLAVGGSFGDIACAIVAGGKVKCWGPMNTLKGLYGTGF
jgi:alpha-tubulin suppressor-like RCC1 family protein